MAREQRGIERITKEGDYKGSQGYPLRQRKLSLYPMDFGPDVTSIHYAGRR